jgi:hypothetical protein
MTKALTLTGLLALVLALAGCGGSSEPNVSRATMGKDWPLTVESGTLSCERGVDVVFKTAGIRYAVNGSAKSRTDLPEIDEIWADDPAPYAPASYVPKKNIGPLIEAGLALC